MNQLNITQPTNSLTPHNRKLITVALIFHYIALTLSAADAVVIFFFGLTMLLNGFSNTHLIFILYSLYLAIPLTWIIPMTLKLKRYQEGKCRVSIGFKICNLLFVSLISGILLLCVNDEPVVPIITNVVPATNTTTVTPATINHKFYPEQQREEWLEVMEVLRNLKQLLDEGIITQEEFDAKKKQILAND